MLDVSAAREVVLRHARPLRPEVTPLATSSLGRVTAADLAADRDSPPFAKAMMDGYAVRSADVGSPNAELRVVGTAAAGTADRPTVSPGQAVRIFTGAPLPPGADAVVRQEDCLDLGGGAVRVAVGPVPPGKDVLPRGKEMAAGDVVLPAGTVLTPAVFGVAAAIGRTAVPAYPAPKVAIVATGDELVEPNTVPGPGQIRNSNGPMLVAQAARAGAVPRYIGIAADDEAVLRSYLSEGLTTAHMLVLAGGVSVGQFDLVPKVLADLGVAAHFHTVRMKPGKPLLFGSRGDVLVFGLPGNPVSSYVGFELFVRPAVRVLAGHPDPGPVTVALPLAEPLSAAHDRPTYHPAAVEHTAAGVSVRPKPWFGSADLRGLLGADAFVVIPPGGVNWPAGQWVEVVRPPEGLS